jgi:adenylylsulfate kinase-like enzyme
MGTKKSTHHCPYDRLRNGLRQDNNAATTRQKYFDSGQSNGGDVSRKILIMGMPGAGKTTLANALAPLLKAVVFNAHAARASLSRDLGSHEDRVEAARLMARCATASMPGHREL